MHLGIFVVIGSCLGVRLNNSSFILNDVENLPGTKHAYIHTYVHYEAETKNLQEKGQKQI